MLGHLDGLLDKFIEGHRVFSCRTSYLKVMELPCQSASAELDFWMESPRSGLHHGVTASTGVFLTLSAGVVPDGIETEQLPTCILHKCKKTCYEIHYMKGTWWQSSVAKRDAGARAGQELQLAGHVISCFMQLRMDVHHSECPPMQNVHHSELHNPPRKEKT